MRKRGCFALIGISVVLVAIGVGLYFILRPKPDDPIAEEGVSLHTALECITTVDLLLFFSGMRSGNSTK